MRSLEEIVAMNEKAQAQFDARSASEREEAAMLRECEGLTGDLGLVAKAVTGRFEEAEARVVDAEAADIVREIRNDSGPRMPVTTYALSVGKVTVNAHQYQLGFLDVPDHLTHVGVRISEQVAVVEGTEPESYDVVGLQGEIAGERLGEPFFVLASAFEFAIRAANILRRIGAYLMDGKLSQHTRDDLHSAYFVAGEKV